VCEQQAQPGFTFQGSFAEFVAIPRADRNLCKLPEKVGFVAAAALGCRFTTAYRAVIQQGRLQAGETVAVFGCGGVGMSVIIIAVAHGARCIAVDPSSAARARALELGACAAVDPSLAGNTGDDGDDEAASVVQQRVRELCAEHNACGAQGADVSVDAAGFKSTCENAVFCARRSGRVVQVGLPLALSPCIPMARVAGWELEIIGSHGCAAADFPSILEMVAKGELQPELLVEAEVSLEEGAKAIEAMDSGSPLGITVVTNFKAPLMGAGDGAVDVLQHQESPPRSENPCSASTSEKRHKS
jgi:alcohol dehydrogenase